MRSRYRILPLLVHIAAAIVVATGIAFAADEASTAKPAQVAGAPPAKPHASASAASSVKPGGSTAKSAAGSPSAKPLPSDLQESPGKPIASPFGPGWDPLQPPPVDPTTTGRGIVSAHLVTAGPADIEELREEEHDGENVLYGVVLDVVLAAGSTTPVLGARSVTLQPKRGQPIPLVATCTPTTQDPQSVWRGSGAMLSGWHVAIGDNAWFCGGGTARLAVRVGEGGIRLIAGKGMDWKGPLLLLFAVPLEAPRRVVLPGAKVDIPAKLRGGETAPAKANVDRASAR